MLFIIKKHCNNILKWDLIIPSAIQLFYWKMTLMEFNGNSSRSMILNGILTMVLGDNWTYKGACLWMQIIPSNYWKIKWLILLNANKKEVVIYYWMQRKNPLYYSSNNSIPLGNIDFQKISIFLGWLNTIPFGDKGGIEMQY